MVKRLLELTRRAKSMIAARDAAIEQLQTVLAECQGHADTEGHKRKKAED